MIVTCPNCKGEGRYYRPVQFDPGPVTEDGAFPVETSYQRELVDCDLCAGSGRCMARERSPVFQDGRKVGTVPPSFDPDRIVSRNMMHVPRPGDFWRNGDTWVANSMLGPGDLDAVVGFIWDR